MSVWGTYESKIQSGGGSKYGAAFDRERRAILTKLPDNLSYEKNVEIFTSQYGFNIDSEYAQSNKVIQDISIEDTDNLDEKIVYSLPGEDIELGSLLLIDGFYWLVYERNHRNVLYTKAKIVQCNHLLKWVQDGEIMSQWCVIEDGTKYMTGELEDRYFVVTRGDSRISMQIARNEHTVRFDRESRFLIDDEDSPHKLSYILTKPLKKGLIYNGSGVYKFVLQEATATGDDNHELGIADYYKYFNADGTKILDDSDDVQADQDTSTTDNPNDPDVSEDTGNRKKVWL